MIDELLGVDEKLAEEEELLTWGVEEYSPDAKSTKLCSRKSNSMMLRASSMLVLMTVKLNEN